MQSAFVSAFFKADKPQSTISDRHLHFGFLMGYSLKLMNFKARSQIDLLQFSFLMGLSFMVHPAICLLTLHVACELYGPGPERS